MASALCLPTAPVVAQPGGPPPPGTPDPGAICATGRLHVGALPELDDAWRITVDADREGALDWRPDAVLVTTEIGCGFLTGEPRIRTTFYSADARGLWDPETAQIRPLDPGDPEPRGFTSDDVDFGVIRDALNGLGLGDETEIGASGITIRLNTANPPFGPASVPPETTVVHVTVGSGGATRDIYIDALTGQTFSFDEESHGDDPHDR